MELVGVLRIFPNLANNTDDEIDTIAHHDSQCTPVAQHVMTGFFFHLESVSNNALGPKEIAQGRTT
jgi:hypothetical protein